MALHFTREEFDERRRQVLAAMAARGLDGLLMFKQDSMYWLTGYDTFGYCFFQCLVLRADGDLVLLTRAPDLRQAQHTSIIEDVRIWVDRADADPAAELRALLAEKRLAGKRVGVEYDTHGLTAANGRRLDAALDGIAEAIDASDLIARLRLVKSATELAYVRRAAELADAALGAAIAETREGADEGAILAAMHAAIFRRRGRLPRQPVHHRLRTRRAALSVQVGASPSRCQRPADPRVRRRLSPVPRLPDAHAPGRSAKRTAARAARRLP